MKEIQDGYQNEFLFVLEFNNKKIKELNPLLRNVIDDLFPNSDDNSVIKSWRNHINYEKGDILIKINNQTRAISIKKGSRNSVHVESLKEFNNFLLSCGIEKNVVDEYNKFHYGIDKNNKKRILSSPEYCCMNEQYIKDINKRISKINYNLILNRFILNGNNSPKYKVKGIIYGSPDDFFWINENEIKTIIKNSLSLESKSVHYGCLFIQPLNRCINNNYKYIWKKDYVQIKWYSLFDDIIKLKSDYNNMT